MYSGRASFQRDPLTTLAVLVLVVAGAFVLVARGFNKAMERK